MPRPAVDGTVKEVYPTAVTMAKQPGRGRWSRPLVEAGLVITLYLVYRAGRLIVTGQEAKAFANAEVVRAAEALLSLPSEVDVQAMFHGLPQVFEVANVYYVYAHFPITIAFLIWGFLYRPAAEYRWARNLLATQTMLALALHMLLPLAPPRMFPELGFVDTMARWGPSAYDGPSAAVANQYAAMPSLHVGWAVLIAVVVYRTGPRPVAALAIGHAAMTCFVVTVTANHWWLDGVVATLLLGVALLVHQPPGERSWSEDAFPDGRQLGAAEAA